MSTLYLIGLLVTIALTVYLFWALFRPEDFS
jgi:K+-transporting ATPase KdpF subunit